MATVSAFGAVFTNGAVTQEVPGFYDGDGIYRIRFSPAVLGIWRWQTASNVEPLDGKLKVYDAPLGVMANAPTYDWHMTNLTNYINLSVKDVEQAKIGAVTAELAAFK